MKTLKVNYKWKIYEIDLDWQIQKELLEKDYNWNFYINIALVREIARTLWWSISEIKTSMEEMWKNAKWDTLIHTHCEVRVYIPKAFKDEEWKWQSKELHWVADDLYRLDWLSRSCFPNMARVQALAVKNALKRVYPFFEADYLQAEDLAERWLIDQQTKDSLTSKTENKDITVYQILEWRIKEAAKKIDMASIVQDIKKAYDGKYITGDEFKELKWLYSTKYDSLWA